jgi:hypothetical protein
VGHRADFDFLEKKKKCVLPLFGIKPRFLSRPARSIIGISTELIFEFLFALFLGRSFFYCMFFCFYSAQREGNVLFSSVEVINDLDEFAASCSM